MIPKIHKTLTKHYLIKVKKNMPHLLKCNEPMPVAKGMRTLLSSFLNFTGYPLKQGDGEV